MKKIKYPLLIVLGLVAALVGFATATAGYNFTQTDENGQTVERASFDDVIAFEKERLKAILGDNTAKITVGKFYFTGTHVRQSDVKGAKWIECAAEKGDQSAIGIMGILHMGGIGVEQSFPMARAWLTQSNEKSAIDLAELLQNFDRAIEILPPAGKESQIKSNYEAAAKDMKAALLSMIEEMK